jgi:hypothetical protein
MPRFRCFGLTNDNRILWGRYLECINLVDAVAVATEIAIEETFSIEIWLRSVKLYPRKSVGMRPNANAAPTRLQSRKVTPAFEVAWSAPAPVQVTVSWSAIDPTISASTRRLCETRARPAGRAPRRQQNYSTNTNARDL